MSRAALCCLVYCALAFTRIAQAGTECRQTEIRPEAMAHATELALNAHAALERQDQPVALIARVGSDVAKYGLKYSHVAFVVRDHPDGRWTVVHLLNRCGTDRSSLFAEGLVNFYLDDLVGFDAKIVWLTAPQSTQVMGLLNSTDIFRLHEPHYNVIARPDSMDYQNSTAWVLEVLVAAQDTSDRVVTRGEVHRRTQEFGFEPDLLRISAGKRLLGGLFAANVAFQDHPRATRLAGRYPVVTVRSIFRLMRDQRWSDAELVLGLNPADERE